MDESLTEKCQLQERYQDDIECFQHSIYSLCSLSPASDDCDRMRLQNDTNKQTFKGVMHESIQVLPVFLPLRSPSAMVTRLALNMSDWMYGNV